MMDFDQTIATVMEAVPEVRVYKYHQYGGKEVLEFRVGSHHGSVKQFCVNVFLDGTILGAWPCDTHEKRLMLRTILDEVERQMTTSENPVESPEATQS